MWFVIDNKVLNFHDCIICYCELFHNNVKNQRKYQSIFIFLKFKLLWSLSNINTLIIIFMNTLNTEFQKQHSRSRLQIIYSLGCYTFKFIYIASSASINKKNVVYLLFYVTHENNSLPYVFCSTFRVFGMGGHRTAAAFMMELFETKGNN